MRWAVSLALLVFAAVAVGGGPAMWDEVCLQDCQACLEGVVAPVEVARCMEQERHRQEEVLERVFQETLERVMPARRERLRRVQEMWRRYRDGKCEFLYDVTTGSGGLADMAECMLRETVRRRRELERL